MRVKISAVLLFCLLLAGGCAGSLDEAMQRANINYRQIVHVKETEAGSLVFYEGPEGLSAGLAAKKLTGWQWVFGGGSAALSSPEGLTWKYANINPEGKPFSLFYGVITNRKITQVRVIDRQANIVDTGIGLKIWYVFFRQPVKPPVAIRGLSKHGKILFSYGH